MGSRIKSKPVSLTKLTDPNKITLLQQILNTSHVR